MPVSGANRTYGGVTGEIRVADRRRKLLGAGMNLFGIHGFRSVRVKDVCSEAGLTERYFYESFSDMESLFEAVLEQTIQDIEAEVTRALEQTSESGMARAKVAVRQAADAMMSDPRKIRVLYVEALGKGGLVAARTHEFNMRAVADLASWASSDREVSDSTSTAAIMAAIAFSGAALELLVSWAEGLIEISSDELADYICRIYERISLG